MNVLVNENSLQDIANAIREKNGVEETYKPSEMGNAIRDIEVGGNTEEAYNEGFEAGKKSEYDTFWDNYQDNGTLNDFTYRFAGGGWDRNTFFPKYDMYATTINTGFHRFNYTDPNWETFDLVEHLDKLGVVFDTSNCTNFTSAFMWACIGRLGVIDLRKNTASLNGTFGYGKIKTIDKIIVHEGIKFETSTFQNQSTLENVTFEGTIGTSLYMQHCSNLTQASVDSIITALKDLTGQTAQTLTFHATVKGNLTDTQIATITSKNWTLA